MNRRIEWLRREISNVNYTGVRLGVALQVLTHVRVVSPRLGAPVLGAKGPPLSSTVTIKAYLARYKPRELRTKVNIINDRIFDIETNEYLMDAAEGPR